MVPLSSMFLEQLWHERASDAIGRRGPLPAVPPKRTRPGVGTPSAPTLAVAEATATPTVPEEPLPASGHGARAPVPAARTPPIPAPRPADLRGGAGMQRQGSLPTTFAHRGDGAALSGGARSPLGSASAVLADATHRRTGSSGAAPVPAPRPTKPPRDGMSAPFSHRVGRERACSSGPRAGAGPRRAVVAAAARPPSALLQDTVTALYDCTADALEDLSFRQGDRVVVLERPPGDWWLGQVLDAHGRPTGPSGLFPRTYVQAP